MAIFSGGPLDGVQSQRRPLVSAQSGAFRGALRPYPSGRVRVAADSAAQSDLLLRGTPPGVLGQHAIEARARRCRARRRLRDALRAGHRSGVRGRGPHGDVALALAHRDPQLRRFGRPGRPRRARAPRRHRRRQPGAGPGSRRLHDPRARADAPRDAPLHVASASVRSQGASARPRIAGARRRARAEARGEDSGGSRDARRRRRGSLRVGQRAAAAHGRGAGLLDRRSQRDQPRLPRIRRGGRIRERVAVERGRGSWLASTESGIRSSGSGIGAPGSGGACGTSSRCRWPGPSTSATPRPRPSPAGRAAACRPRPSTTAPPSARRRARSGGIRGATPRRTRRAGTSTSRAGIPSPSGSYPAGASAWGVHDLVGNGWEWTSTVFAPFEGFRADAVVSPVLGGLLRRPALRHEGRLAGDGAASSIRPSFRNWFRPTYPYVYAKFRTAE